MPNKDYIFLNLDHRTSSNKTKQQKLPSIVPFVPEVLQNILLDLSFHGNLLSADISAYFATDLYLYLYINSKILTYSNDFL